MDDNKYQSQWSDESKPDFTQDVIHDVKKVDAPVLKISAVSHKVFWALIGMVAVIATIAGFYFYNYFSTSQEIALKLSAPKNVLAGVPFDLVVNFDNGSKSILKNATLSVFLPEGAVILGESKDKRVFTKELGGVEPAAALTEKINLLIFNSGAENAKVKNFNVSVSYDSALGTRFEKKQNIEIFGLESAIKLDIAAPEKVLNNEDFEVIVKYANVSEYDFANVRLNLKMPLNFVIKKSTPEISGNVFSIGALPKNKSGELVISGKINNMNQTFFEIVSDTEVFYNGQSFKINEKTAKINIAPSPLFLKIESYDDSSGYFSPGDVIKFKISYFNNSDVGLSDAVIKAKLSGEMFDFSKLKTNGAYDSRNNILSWNAASNPALRLIDSGNGGEIEFEIGVRAGYPIKRLSDKNFVLKIAAEISSPTVPYYVSADKTIGLAEWEAKIAGAVSVEAIVYFRDPSILASGIINKSSLPPRANQPINFTIHWKIRNYATDVKDIIVDAYLGPGVRIVGETKSNINTVPIYNERTQYVSWRIDRIAAAKGVINNPVEAVFQVELLPNTGQIGNYPNLIGKTSISAIDEFINLKLTDEAKELTTKDLSDSGFDQGSGEVAP